MPKRDYDTREMAMDSRDITRFYSTTDFRMIFMDKQLHP